MLRRSCGAVKQEGLGRLVLVYIMVVVTAFGLMLAVLQQGW